MKPDEVLIDLRFPCWGWNAGTHRFGVVWDENATDEDKMKLVAVFRDWVRDPDLGFTKEMAFAAMQAMSRGQQLMDAAQVLSVLSDESLQKAGDTSILKLLTDAAESSDRRWMKWASEVAMKAHCISIDEMVALEGQVR